MPALFAKDIASPSSEVYTMRISLQFIPLMDDFENLRFDELHQNHKSVQAWVFACLQAARLLSVQYHC